MHADVEHNITAEVMTSRLSIPRGGAAVRRMQSWKDMADWLREYQNHWFLKATELSRMWTQIVQVRLPRFHLRVSHSRCLGCASDMVCPKLPHVYRALRNLPTVGLLLDAAVCLFSGF